MLGSNGAHFSSVDSVDRDKGFSKPAKPGGRPPSIRMSTGGVVRRVTAPSSTPAKPPKATKSTTPKLTRKESKSSLKGNSVSKESRKAVSAALKKQPMPGAKPKKNTTSSPLFSLKKKTSKPKGDVHIPKQQKPKFSKELKAKLKAEE